MKVFNVSEISGEASALSAPRREHATAFIPLFVNQEYFFLLNSRRMYTANFVELSSLWTVQIFHLSLHKSAVVARVSDRAYGTIEFGVGRFI